jgi:predicted phage terminase large subunit-like protein
MNSKEEIEELRKYLQDLPLLAREGSVDRKEKALKSFFFFIITYFPHHVDEMTEESSAFRSFIHDNIEPLAVKYKKLFFSAYRGGAKSTTLSRLYPLWKLARGETRFHVTISDTIDVAKSNLEFMKVEIEENKTFAYDFNIKKSYIWTEEQVVIETPVGLVKFKAFGSGKRIRGMNFLGFRPDLIVLDDIENDENVESKKQRDKLYEWFKKAIMKLPNRKKPYILIVVGTILHHDSVLARIGKRKDFFTKSFPLVLSFPRNMDAWEKLYTLDLVEARKRYENRKEFYAYDAKLDDSEIDLFDVMMEYFEDIDSFMSELQNTPITTSKLIFGDYITYSEMPRVDAYYIGVDPSLGKSKKSDYFGLGYLAYSKSEKKFYSKIKGYKIPAIDMIPKIIDLYVQLKKTGKPVVLAIETVAFQEFYKDTLILFSKSHDIHIPVITYNNTASKELRIEATAPLYRDGTILVHEHDYIFHEELDTYPKSPHDDLLDTAEMAHRAFSGLTIADYKAFKRAIENNKFKFLNSRNNYD